MSELIIKTSEKNWAPINRRMADDSRLSLSARAVLLWFLSRPAGHDFKLWQALQRWDISEPTWLKISAELQMLGYLKYTKTKKDGKFTHKYEVTDTPSTASVEPSISTEDEFNAALESLNDDVEDWRYMANAKHKGSNTEYHWKNHCLPQLQLIHKNSGVEGMREALNEALYLGLRDFQCIINGSIKAPL